MIPCSNHFPTVVFLGDSIATGWRALSHLRNRWILLVCERRRWREVNLAADGLDFLARHGGHLPGEQRSSLCRDTTWLKAMLRCEPDVVAINLGLNDAAFLPSQCELAEQAIDHDLSFISTHLRDTPVIIAPYFPSLEAGPRSQAIRRLVHEKATPLGLASTDALSTVIDGDEDRLAVGQIHPDDAGRARVAHTIISFYAEILPGS